MFEFDFSLLLRGQYNEMLVAGLLLSLKLAAVTLVFAVPLAMLVALLRLAPFRALQWLGFAYVESIRNVPLLAHMLFWYFAAPEWLPEDLKAWLYAGNIEAASAIVALTLYTAAFMSEDMRSGIRAVPTVQLEAARALGFGYLASMRLVILPQALRNMLPSLVNQFVSTIKETSLGYIIGLAEVSFIASQINTQVFTLPTQVYLILGLTYFILCFGLSRFAFWLERRQAQRGNPKEAR